MNNRDPIRSGDPKFPELRNPKPGDSCHVTGWGRGCVFRVVRLEHGMALVKTPKTGRMFTVKASRLCGLRQD